MVVLLIWLCNRTQSSSDTGVSIATDAADTTTCDDDSNNVDPKQTPQSTATCRAEPAHSAHAPPPPLVWYEFLSNGKTIEACIQSRTTTHTQWTLSIPYDHISNALSSRVTHQGRQVYNMAHTVDFLDYWCDGIKQHGPHFNPDSFDDPTKEKVIIPHTFPTFGFRYLKSSRNCYCVGTVLRAVHDVQTNQYILHLNSPNRESDVHIIPMDTPHETPSSEQHLYHFEHDTNKHQYCIPEGNIQTFALTVGFIFTITSTVIFTTVSTVPAIVTATT